MSEPIKILVEGRCQVGIGEVEITPDHNLAMAGYSTSGQVAVDPPESSSFAKRLFAKTLFVEDENGEQVAMCFVDLLSGSLILWNSVHKLLSETIAGNRVLLVGSHTHNGPGHYFGNKLYNTFAQTTKLANPNRGKQAPGLTEFLADKIATSIKDAKENLQNGRLVIVQSRLWELAVNRSSAAFNMNPEADIWNDSGMPGHPHPAGLHDVQLKVDPRVTTWLAFDDSNGDQPLALFSTVPCHSTCLGPPFKHYSGDWPGHAAKLLKEEEEFGLTGTQTAFALPPAGDASPLSVADIHKGHGKDSQGIGLMVDRAKLVATHISEVVQTALAEIDPSPDPLSLQVRFGYWVPQGGPFSVQPVVGRPLLAGAEDGRGPQWLSIFGIKEGDPSPFGEIPQDPQSPKRTALGLIQFLFGSNLIQPSPHHPISQVHFGSHVVATIPGEITMAAGLRIENELVAQSSGSSSASLISNTNDYIGYITTIQEYREQHYEGGHTLFGKFSRWNLTNAILGLPLVSIGAPLSAAHMEGPEEVASELRMERALEQITKSPVIIIEELPEANLLSPTCFKTISDDLDFGTQPETNGTEITNVTVLFMAGLDKVENRKEIYLTVEGSDEKASPENIVPLGIQHHEQDLFVAFFALDDQPRKIDRALQFQIK